MGTVDPLDNDSYTIGWIAALKEEAAAASGMLDVKFGREPKTKHPVDQNVYTLGRIGPHNLVIASLPAGSYGTVSATTTASHLLASFPSIKVVLMVGIGGGIPRPEDGQDIRLGDVVVSQPKDGHGGVIQYDFGKTTAGGHFEQTGWLRPPPRVLLNALAALQEEHEMSDSRIPEFVHDMLRRFPRMVGAHPSYAYQGVENDNLFLAEYNHPEKEPDCLTCDSSEWVRREPRNDTAPRIHYGVIASGNQVMKDGHTRDTVGKNCLCFEMEAAGLMNDFPCLVIRGICDYSDSHKNKRWQKYAAAVVAAYAKELLSVVPIAEVERAQKAIDLVKSVNEAVQNAVQQGQVMTNQKLDSATEERERRKRLEILAWLTPVNYTAHQHDFISRRKDGTGSWFLESPEVQRWVTGDKDVLLCTGIPGAGKTFLTATLIDFLQHRIADCVEGLAYVFCAHDRHDEATVERLLLSFVKQLSVPEMPDVVCKSHDKHSRQNTRPDVSEIRKMLEIIVAERERTYLIIDALDELPLSQSNADAFFSHLGQLLTDLPQSKLRILATSRTGSDKADLFKQRLSTQEEFHIRADQDDISKYVTSELAYLSGVVRDNPELQEKIRQDVTRASGDMFLLARLHVDSLQDKRTVFDVESALEGLSSEPQSLDTAYQATLYRIRQQRIRDQDLAFAVFGWIFHAVRLLKIDELIEALATSPGDRGLHHKRFYQPEDLVAFCAGLVTINASDELAFSHATVHDYFGAHPETLDSNFHEHAARICITHLSFQNFLDMEVVYPSATSFQSYAFHNWDKHAIHCQNKIENVALAILRNPRQMRAFLAPLFNLNWTIVVTHGTFKTTNLHLTAGLGLDHLFEILLENTSLADCLDDGDHTPLLYAIKYKQISTARVLLRRGDVDVNRVAHSGFTPLITTIEKDSLEIFRLLLDHDDIDVNKNSRTIHTYIFTFVLREDDVDDESGMTPLHVAVVFRRTDMVQSLLKHRDVDVNRVDQDGKTALELAIDHSEADIIQLLLAHSDTAVNLENSNGESLLFVAIYKGRIGIVRLLLENPRTNVNLGNRFRESPLLLAVDQSKIEIAQILLEDPRTDVNLSSDVGVSPLHLATAWGKFEIARILLEDPRTDVNFCERSRESPLMCAIRKSALDVVELLLNHAEVDVNQAFPEEVRKQETFVDLGRRDHGDFNANARFWEPPQVCQDTALSLAIILGHEDVVRSLLSLAHIDVNIGRVKGMPLLKFAMERNDWNLVAVLLHRGADRNLETVYPFIYKASYHNQNHIVKQLLEKPFTLQGYNRRSWWAKSTLIEVARVTSTVLPEYSVPDSELPDQDLEWFSWILKHYSPVPEALETGLARLLFNAYHQRRTKRYPIRAPFLCPVSEREVADIIEALLEACGDLGGEDRAGGIALLHVCRSLSEKTFAAQYLEQKSFVSVMKLLIAKGSDLDVADADGTTPLMLLLKVAHIRGCRLLIEAGAEIPRQEDTPTQSISASSSVSEDGLDRSSKRIKLLTEEDAEDAGTRSP